MQIKILYEDEYILALDKPSGIMVHGDGRSKEETLVDWINENYHDLKEVGEPLNMVRGKEQKNKNGFTVSVVERPGIVHRLDKETSGVIIVAKTKEAHAYLKEQFQNRKVQKIYNAVVWGTFLPEKMEGVIDKPIGRSASDFRRWSAEYGAKGEMREAVTEYKVLAQKNNAPGLRLDPSYIKMGKEKEEGMAYLEVRPKTGRTHQIRVHLKSISHPVICDKLYSNKACDKESCLGFDRLALHAFSIDLTLPNKTHLVVESSLPKEFEKAKKILS